MSRLPENVMNKITSYNFTTYTDNEVIIKFTYKDDEDYTSPYAILSYDIIIKWDTDIAAYYRSLLLYSVEEDLFDWQRAYTHRDYERQKINEKLKEIPDYQTIFGDDEETGLVNIDPDGSDEDKIRLDCMFYYLKEGERFQDPVDLMSDRGLRMRKAVAFLLAHTVVNTLKYIIPTPDTKIQDYLTFDKDGNRINQNFSNVGVRHAKYDYKLHKKDKCIYSLDFWMKKISIVPSEETNVKFTLVNNKSLPITRGSEGVYMRQLTALLKF